MRNLSESVIELDIERCTIHAMGWGILSLEERCSACAVLVVELILRMREANCLDYYITLSY
jgi:hypothetical protein